MIYGNPARRRQQAALAAERRPGPRAPGLARTPGSGPRGPERARTAALAANVALPPNHPPGAGSLPEGRSQVSSSAPQFRHIRLRKIPRPRGRV